ncbi:glycosyltransferase family 4 protein [Microbacterium sp. E-13]|uniref:glycosyltransferase family 4 protein n=1 Tax=Microbacterium sp. E-13 TaxID=3404048 RepID=UPI003CEE34F9
MDRIFLNGRFLTQPLTGVQRFALEISKALMSRRDDLTLLVPRAKLAIEPPRGAELRVVGVSGGHLWEQTELPAYLKRAGEPLLVSLGSTGPAYYKNQIVTHHDITYVRHPESFSAKTRAVYRAIVPHMLQNCLAVVTVSEFSRNEISRHFGVDAAKIFVVPNAVGSGFKARSSGPARGAAARPYFLAVSSLNAHKNFGGLVRAYRQSGVASATDLRIVGGQAKAFARIDVDLNTPGVRLMGSVSDETLVDLYQGALSFVFPSLYEGFGIPPLEAQKCGSPVIAANIPALRETLERSAHFVDPLDVADIALALRTLAHDAGLRERLAALGAANARRYSWESSAAIVDGLIRQAMQSGSSVSEAGSTP